MFRKSPLMVKTSQSLMLDRAQITETVADFWDKITEGWRVIWGPHIHHGYYDSNKAVPPLAAQIKLIEKLAEKVEIAPHATILDVGCGIGGSSLYLAKKYNARVTGITLSAKQVDIANEQVSKHKIKNVLFKVEDALSLQSFASNFFDIVWAVESCEQFYDKELFIQQAYRVLKPGGKLILATWCSDREEYTGKLARKYRDICFAFDLPYMPTIDWYCKLLESNSFNIKEASDWSQYVAKSWEIGLTLAKAYSYFQQLKIGGWRGWRFIRQIKMMRDGFQEQRVKYGVFLAEKLSSE